MISLLQYIKDNKSKDNKSSLISLDEKLIINKEFSGVNYNDMFYDKFEDDFVDLSTDGKFKTTDSVNKIYAINIPFSYKSSIENEIRKRVPKNNSIFYSVIVDSHQENIYKKMIEYINDNYESMSFFIDKSFSGGDYTALIFETTDYIIGLIGSRKFPLSIVDSVILFTYK